MPLGASFEVLRVHSRSNVSLYLLLENVDKEISVPSPGWLPVCCHATRHADNGLSL